MREVGVRPRPRKPPARSGTRQIRITHSGGIAPAALLSFEGIRRPRAFRILSRAPPGARQAGSGNGHVGADRAAFGVPGVDRSDQDPVGPRFVQLDRIGKGLLHLRRGRARVEIAEGEDGLHGFARGGVLDRDLIVMDKVVVRARREGEGDGTVLAGRQRQRTREGGGGVRRFPGGSRVEGEVRAVRLRSGELPRRFDLFLFGEEKIL